MALRALRLSVFSLALSGLLGCGGDDSTSGSGTSTTSTTDSTSSTTVEPVPACERPTTWTPPPACGSKSVTLSTLVAGEGSPEFDAALADKALRLDRQFHALNGFATGMNADSTVPVDATVARDRIAEFLTMDDGWDFEAYSGVPVTDVLATWGQSPGAYAGPGAAADAFRYGVLRDTGADCDAIETAKQHVLADLESLHIAVAITGVPGVIARGIAKKGLGGDGEAETTPLFDASGSPLPPEKNNGTWREDNSGLYPDHLWIDSCSRDMLIGWAVGYAGIWEVIRLDPAFPDDLKTRMQADAESVVRSLMVVGDKGYDLEIHDADGRLTLFAYLNENAIDTGYLPGAENGSLALMALGIVAALNYVAEEPDVDEYLYGQLVRDRKLPEMARDNMIGLSLGTKSNYSNYNMAFDAGWLAHRYMCGDEARKPARDVLREALSTAVYARPGDERQPDEQGQSFYDLVYVATSGGALPGEAASTVDDAAVSRALSTLVEFPDAPFWEEPRPNCDDQEIASGDCTAVDGTPIHVLGYVGRNDALVAEKPLPMRIRPPSNYFWRTDPYLVNGDADGSRLLPSADFRMAYWMGRWIRR